MDLLIAGIIFSIFGIVASIPLNIAVHILGGETNLLKTFLVNILSTAFVFLVNIFVTSNGFVSFTAMLFIYKLAFDIGWIRAFIAWLLSAVIFTAILIAIVLFRFGALEGITEIISIPFI